MKRRKFIQKAILTSGAIALSSGVAVGELNKTIAGQKFNFMTETHPNLTLIKNFFTAYANNDLDAIGNILAADIKWHIPGMHPLSGTKTGVAEVLAFFKKLGKASLKAEPIVMGVNDHYVIDCHKNWSNIENEENFNGMSCLLWKIENNKIIEVFNFPENQHIVDAFFSRVYR